MSEPIKVDILGSVWSDLKKIVVSILCLGWVLIVTLIIIGAILGVGALCVGSLVLLATLIGVSYRRHPHITSILTVTTGVVGSFFMITAGPPLAFWCVPVILVGLYGLLILPPAELDLKDPLKYDNSKLYALSIWSILLLVGSGLLISIGLACTPSLPESIAVVMFCPLIGVIFTYLGIQYAHRQKEYLIDPVDAMKKWEDDKKEVRRKLKEIENKELAKKESKKLPKTPTPFEQELVRKVKVAKTTIKEMGNFTH